jgi:ribosomal protein S18 acetylase RimI-like enzyme
MDPSQLPPQILRVPPEDREEALRLVFRGMGEAERRQQIAMLVEAERRFDEVAPAAAASTGLARQAATGEAAWNGLFAAYRGRRIVGAILGQPQPGRLAALWPPQLVGDEPPPSALRLLDRTDQYFLDQGIQIAQALLDARGASDAEVLLRGGFVYLADLVYLVCDNGQFPAAEPLTALEFESWTARRQQRLSAIVDATYTETLDCPALNGVRQVEDVLAGYRASGVFDAERWWLVREEGRDGGCLILADFPRQDTWELVYMGVVPGGRGHGLGGQMVRRAQWLARRAGRSRLVLAVDARNTPALGIYAAAGFQAFDRRAACVKVYRPP